MMLMMMMTATRNMRRASWKTLENEAPATPSTPPRKSKTNNQKNDEMTRTFFSCLIVVSSRHNFLAGRTQKNRVLELSSVAPSLVHQRRVRSHQTRFAQLRKSSIKHFQTIKSQETLAKRQSVVSFVNVSKETFGLLGSNGNVSSIPILHKMRALQIFHNLETFQNKDKNKQEYRKRPFRDQLSQTFQSHNAPLLPSHVDLPFLSQSERFFQHEFDMEQSNDLVSSFTQECFSQRFLIASPFKLLIALMG
jgi:hypothetical protein